MTWNLILAISAWTIGLPLAYLAACEIVRAIDRHRQQQQPEELARVLPMRRRDEQ